MTVREIRDLITSVDSKAKHYDCTDDVDKRRDFTVWMEYEAIIATADDVEAEAGWRFEVNRFTKQEYDPMAEALRDALQNTPGVTIRSYRVQYSQGARYIRHIFDCEGV